MATVLLDCDGVLLEWDLAFARWCRQHHDIDPSLDGPQSWGLGEWLGTDDKTALDLVARFNASPCFGNIWPCTKALQGVFELVQDGHRIEVVTSCSDDASAIAARKKNLLTSFGDVFDKLHCLPLGASKDVVLSNYAPGAIWVEDNYTHALAGRILGHHTFMIKRSHNRAQESASDPMIRWVSDWANIVSLARRVT